MSQTATNIVYALTAIALAGAAVLFHADGNNALSAICLVGAAGACFAEPYE